jgi:CubicO group peptidase (beta-lactamase class C family)
MCTAVTGASRVESPDRRATLEIAPLTPILRALLPSGIVGERRGRGVAYRPFYVPGAAHGGLVGGVADAARLLLLHLNDGVVDGARLLPAAATAEMRRVDRDGRRGDQHVNRGSIDPVAW